MEKIAAIKRGDARAFTDIFDASYQKTFSFFMSRTNRDRELAKELTQITYIKVWQSKHTLSEEHSLDAQLFTIARSILIDHLRSSATQRTAQQEAGRKVASIKPSIDFQTTAFETNDFMFAILKKLPPARKKILQMKFVYGYSNREIAGLLSISVKTVEDHVTKGLHDIRANTTASVAFSLFFSVASVWNA